jgi:four helix bundle protein
MREQSGFEKLDVFLLAEDLADAVWTCVRRWDGLALHTLGRQLVRAADSFGANIAEGYGRGSDADRRRFVRIAIGSLYETKYWFRRAFRRELLTEDQVGLLQPLVQRLLPMLNGYLRSIGRAKRSADPRPPTPD